MLTLFFVYWDNEVKALFKIFELNNEDENKTINTSTHQ